MRNTSENDSQKDVIIERIKRKLENERKIGVLPLLFELLKSEYMEMRKN